MNVKRLKRYLIITLILIALLLISAMPVAAGMAWAG
jgi:hypothetical protein